MVDLRHLAGSGRIRQGFRDITLAERRGAVAYATKVERVVVEGVVDAGAPVHDLSLQAYDMLCQNEGRTTSQMTYLRADSLRSGAGRKFGGFAG
jgi:hypothetical protein